MIIKEQTDKRLVVLTSKQARTCWRVEIIDQGGGLSTLELIRMENNGGFTNILHISQGGVITIIPKFDKKKIKNKRIKEYCEMVFQYWCGGGPEDPFMY